MRLKLVMNRQSILGSWNLLRHSFVLQLFLACGRGRVHVLCIGFRYMSKFGISIILSRTI